VHSNRSMKCHTPNCIGEHEEGTISHSVLHRERTIVIHNVPASICFRSRAGGPYIGP